MQERSARLSKVEGELNGSTSMLLTKLTPEPGEPSPEYTAVMDGVKVELTVEANERQLQSAENSYRGDHSDSQVEAGVEEKTSL